MALQAGLKKGGAAKGELVLAIFELANCFRHGWGIHKDAIAAKQVSCTTPEHGGRCADAAAPFYFQYYETAANLGDTGEWCYCRAPGLSQEGFSSARRGEAKAEKLASDAMNEVAWCYLEGFGCKKDKVSHPYLSTACTRTHETYGLGWPSSDMFGKVRFAAGKALSGWFLVGAQLSAMQRVAASFSSHEG